MSEINELSWAIGLFEGEGSFSLRQRKRKDGTYYKRLCMKLSSTDEDVVRRFHQIVKCGIVNGPYKHKRSTINWKDRWDWSVSGEAAEILGKIFLPHLSERRQAQFTDKMDNSTKSRYPNRKANSDWISIIEFVRD